MVVRIFHFRDISFTINNFIFSFCEMTTMVLFRIKHFMPASQSPNMSLMHCTNVIHYSENYLTKIPQKCHTNKIYERRKKTFLCGCDINSTVICQYYIPCFSSIYLQQFCVFISLRKISFP